MAQTQTSLRDTAFWADALCGALAAFYPTDHRLGQMFGYLERTS